MNPPAAPVGDAEDDRFAREKSAGIAASGAMRMRISPETA
jgi:hypothetical protein